MSDHSVIFKFISVILLITNKRCRCLSIQIPNQQHQENQFFPTSGSFKFLMLQRCRRGLLTSEETPIISNLLPLHPVYFYLSCFLVHLFLSTSISDRWICQTKTDNGYYFIPIIITHKTGIIGIYGYCIILRKSSCLTFSILHQTCPGSRLQSPPPPSFFDCLSLLLSFSLTSNCLAHFLTWKLIEYFVSTDKSAINHSKSL